MELPGECRNLHPLSIITKFKKILVTIAIISLIIFVHTSVITMIMALVVVLATTVTIVLTAIVAGVIVICMKRVMIIQYSVSTRIPLVQIGFL